MAVITLIIIVFTLFFIPTSYRNSSLSFSSQRPLHPPHPWLHSHHPRFPSQLLLVLQDPRYPTIAQPHFPGEEGGCGPHPAQVARHDAQAAPHHQPATARLQKHQVQDRFHRKYQVPAERRTGDRFPSQFPLNVELSNCFFTSVISAVLGVWLVSGWLLQCCSVAQLSLGPQSDPEM